MSDPSLPTPAVRISPVVVEDVEDPKTKQTLQWFASMGQDFNVFKTLGNHPDLMAAFLTFA
ncbi:hypothetical protein KIPB_012876, partial [Kipferlia bialata]|eukprot:g12876.t1